MKEVILVTGASGFIGLEVCKQLDFLNYTYYPLCFKNVKNTKFISCDLSNITEAEKILDRYKPTIVINISAIVNFNNNINSNIYSLNVLFPSILAEYCRNSNAFLIQLSTIAINNKKNKYIGPDSEILPSNDYSMSKYLAEEIIKFSGCSYVILRLGGVFGKNGPSHLGINKSISNAINNINPTYVGNGVSRRNYIYVKDVANSIIKCFEEKIMGIHYLGGEIKTIKNMLDIICDIRGNDIIPMQVIGDETDDEIIMNSKLFNFTPFYAAIKEVL